MEAKNEQIDYYEDWPDDYDEPLPIGKPIISVYLSAKKGVSIGGAYVRIPQLDDQFKNSEGFDSTLVMIGKISEVAGYIFTKTDAARLTKIIRPWVKDLYQNDSTVARCVPLDDFFAWALEFKRP